MTGAEGSERSSTSSDRSSFSAAGQKLRLKIPARSRLNKFISKTLLPSFLGGEDSASHNETSAIPAVAYPAVEAPEASQSRGNVYNIPESTCTRIPSDSRSLLSVPTTTRNRPRAESSVSDLAESLTGLSLWASHSSASIYESVKTTISNKVVSETESGVAFNDDDDEDYEKYNEHAKDPFSLLPSEVLIEVFSSLSPADVSVCMQVSKVWNEFASSTIVWRRQFQNNRFWQTVDDLPQDLDWTALFKTRLELEKRWRKGQVTAKVLAGHSDSVYCVEFDEDVIITGSRDQSIKIWDAAGGKLLKTLPESDDLAHTGSVLCLCKDDRIMVSGSSDTSCIIWDLKKYKPIIQVFRHNQGVLDLSMDSNHIVSCSKDSTLCVWDRTSSDYRLKHRFRGHVGPVNAVQLHGDLIVSGGGDATVRIWSISQRTLVMELKGHSRGLACIQVSPCGNKIISGGNDNMVRIWDIHTGQCLHLLEGHKSLVRSVFVFNDKIISASYDQTIKVWDLETGKLVSDLEGWHGSWIFSAKGDCKRIISSSLGIKPVILDFSHGLSQYYLDLIKA